MRRPLRLVLFGAPGVGKGTYARLLLPRLGVVHVSSGDILRAKAGEEGREGALAEDLREGRLVDDELVTPLVAQRLRMVDVEERGVLLDGFPRRASQVGLLEGEGLLEGAEVLHLRMEERFLVQKAVARRVCSSCGRGYNVADIHEGTVRMPALLPEVEGRCDSCGGGLVQRADDTLETVQARMRTYHEETFPALDALREQGTPVVDVELTSGAEDTMPVLTELCEGRGWFR